MWSVPYDEFTKENSECLSKLNEANDIDILVDIYIKVLNACFRACEEYDDQHQDEYEDDNGDFSMYAETKLEKLLLNDSVHIISDDWGWLGPYTDYHIDDDGDIIFYSPMYYADGTFVKNKDKYGLYIRNRYLSTNRPKKVDGKFVYLEEDIQRFRELIQDILDMYKKYDDLIVY